MTIPVLSRLTRRRPPRSRTKVQRDPLFEDPARVEDDQHRLRRRGRADWAA